MPYTRDAKGDDVVQVESSEDHVHSLAEFGKGVLRANGGSGFRDASRRGWGQGWVAQVVRAWHL
jgi:hypothetical protein